MCLDPLLCARGQEDGSHMGHHTWRTPVSLTAAALLALTACAEDEDPDPAGENAKPDVTDTAAQQPEDSEPEDADTDDADADDTDTDDADTVGSEPEEPEEETTEAADALPPGGADRIADEDIDPETQGEPTETNFSAEGEEIGFNEWARESIEIWAAPPVPGDEDQTEPVAELAADDVVQLGGREILPAQADGIWVEVELADGYGWVEAMVLEGFEGPDGQ